MSAMRSCGCSRQIQIWSRTSGSDLDLLSCIDACYMQRQLAVQRTKRCLADPQRWASTSIPCRCMQSTPREGGHMGELQPCTRHVGPALTSGRPCVGAPSPQRWDSLMAAASHLTVLVGGGLLQQGPHYIGGGCSGAPTRVDVATPHRLSLPQHISCTASAHAGAPLGHTQQPMRWAPGSSRTSPKVATPGHPPDRGHTSLLRHTHSSEGGPQKHLRHGRRRSSHPALGLPTPAVRNQPRRGTMRPPAQPGGCRPGAPGTGQPPPTATRSHTLHKTHHAARGRGPCLPTYDNGS